MSQYEEGGPLSSERGKNEAVNRNLRCAWGKSTRRSNRNKIANRVGKEEMRKLSRKPKTRERASRAQLLAGRNTIKTESKIGNRDFARIKPQLSLDLQHSHNLFSSLPPLHHPSTQALSLFTAMFEPPPRETGMMQRFQRWRSRSCSCAHQPRRVDPSHQHGALLHTTPRTLPKRCSLRV